MAAVVVQDVLLVLNREICSGESWCSYPLPRTVCAFKKQNKQKSNMRKIILGAQMRVKDILMHGATAGLLLNFSLFVVL